MHTLLDLRLLAIDPATRKVVLSKRLAGTEYEPLCGRPLAAPAEDWQSPSQDALERSWQDYTESEDPAL